MASRKALEIVKAFRRRLSLRHLMLNKAQAPTAILGLLKDHEIELSRLYGVYASKFPEYEDFWTELSGEEVQHAEWIDELQAKVADSPTDFVVDRFSIVAVVHSIEYVRKQVQRVQHQEITPMQAFSTALHLEEAPIEKKFFETFDGDSKEIEQTLALLAQCTQDHYNKVHRMWMENE